MSEFLEGYVTNVDPGLGYASAKGAKQDAVTTRTMLQFVGGLTGMIFVQSINLCLSFSIIFFQVSCL